VNYFLEDFKKNLDRLIVVCNGKLTPEGRQEFSKYTNEIIVRENKGFDVWAYKEGIEYSKYENIPVAVLKRYEEYIEKIKTYGIKIESKDFYINSLEKKEEVYSKKLLDLNSLRELEIKGIKRLVIENSIVTSSAQEYAKDKNIEIIKRR